MGKSALRLDTRRALKDGTYPVQIKVGYGTNLYLSTGIYLAPSDWNAKLQVCIGPGSRKINNILGMLLLSINNRIVELMERGVFTTLTKDQLRQMLTNLKLNAPTVDVPSLGEYFTKVIELKTGSTRTSYDQTRKRLSEYCGDLDKVKLSDVNYTFLEGWQQQMSGYKRNTVSRRMKDLKAVIRHVQAQPEVNKEELTIVGNSYGGLIVGLVAAELQEEIKCLVMQYPGFLIPDICWSGHLMYFDFDPYDIKDAYEGGRHIFGGQFIREGQQLDSYAVIPQYRGRTLIVQGTADPVVPATDSIRAWRRFCSIRNEQETTKLVLIEGAGHGFEGKDFDRSVEEIHAFVQNGL